MSKTGKSGLLEISNLSIRELKEAQEAMSKERIVSLQVEYNLFDRTIENDILPYCENNGITTIAYSPLNQGLVANGNEKIKVLERIAKKYGKTTAQIVLNWLVHHPSVVAIPKAINNMHIIQNAFCTDFTLADEDYEEINKTFVSKYALVPTDKIRIILGGQNNRQVYQTIKEAIENKLGFVPSPVDLAQDIKMGEILKPVRVVKGIDKIGKYDYDLVEGRVRYWAWVIAHNGEEPIPVLIREEK